MAAKAVTQDNRTVHFEAPYSMNTRYISPSGFIVQLTMRGDSDTLIADFHNMLRSLLDMQCTPCDGRGQPVYTEAPAPDFAPANPNGPSYNNGNHYGDGQANDTALGWCAKHGVQMTLRHKDGAEWYSHRLPDGTWCRGGKA